MAEGLLRQFGGDNYQVYSAGTEKTSVRPRAIQVMSEIGIDISHQESKTLEQYRADQFDEVITVCDDANEACPVFPNAKNRRHWSFPDPSKVTGTDDEQLRVYRACGMQCKNELKKTYFYIRKRE
jgi:arsenate reductase (thioredoxin)